MPGDADQDAALHAPANDAVMRDRFAVPILIAGQGSRRPSSFWTLSSVLFSPCKQRWRNQRAATADAEQTPDDRDRRFEAVGRIVATFQSIGRSAYELDEPSGGWHA